jgi:hypothetical protein
MKNGKPRRNLLWYLNCIVHCLDFSYHIAHHLIGANHTPIHRKVVGVLIMVLGGSLIGIIGELGHSVMYHVLGDVIGNGVHGIGLIPFIKDVEKKIEA